MVQNNPGFMGSLKIYLMRHSFDCLVVRLDKAILALLPPLARASHNLHFFRYWSLLLVGGGDNRQRKNLGRLWLAYTELQGDFTCCHLHPLTIVLSKKNHGQMLIKSAQHSLATGMGRPVHQKNALIRIEKIILWHPTTPPSPGIHF